MTRLNAVLPLCAVLAAVLSGCSTESDGCNTINRCNGNTVEQCSDGFATLEMTCSGVETCVQITDQFATCAIANSSGGPTACDNNFRCLNDTQRSSCASDSRLPGMSWKAANDCLSGKKCYDSTPVGTSTECR